MRASSPAIRPAASRCARASRCAAIGRADGAIVLRLSGEGHRLPAAGWLRTVEQALRDEDVDNVRLPSLGQQVAGARRAGGARRPGRPGRRRRRRRRPRRLAARPELRDRHAGLLSADFLGRVGTAAQLAALAFDTGPRPASLGSTYLVSSDRVLRGWTLELFLVALLIPPVFALIDAAARARARGARPSITLRRVLWRAAGWRSAYS